MNKYFKWVLLNFAVLSLWFSACTDSQTAGVLTETESGQTIAGNVIDIQGNTVEQAAVALIRLDSATHSTYADTTVYTDSLGEFSIVCSSKEIYGLLVSYSKEDSEISAFIPKERFSIASEFLSTDSAYTTIKVDSITLDEPATLQFSGDFSGLNVGDSLCINGTQNCVVLSEQDLEGGMVTFTNVPYGYISEIVALGSSNQVFNIALDLEAGGTTYATDSFEAEILDSLLVTLPTNALELLQTNSLDPVLDSLIIPITLGSSVDGSLLLLSKNRVLPEVQKITDSSFYVTLGQIKESNSLFRLVKKAYDFENTTEVPQNRIKAFYATTDSNTAIDKGLFSEDSSMAFSFWIQDSTTDSLGAILSALNITDEDTIGFEIRQCPSSSNYLCTKVYNGVDTASTDTLEYGKFLALDGSPHFATVVFHKKHLSIAFDGETIRDTDIKLSEAFYELSEIKFGSIKLENFMLFSFGDYIRYSGEIGWIRLNAWVMAFYQLQK